MPYSGVNDHKWSCTRTKTHKEEKKDQKCKTGVVGRCSVMRREEVNGMRILCNFLSRLYGVIWRKMDRSSRPYTIYCCSCKVSGSMDPTIRSTYSVYLFPNCTVQFEQKIAKDPNLRWMLSVQFERALQAREVKAVPPHGNGQNHPYLVLHIPQLTPPEWSLQGVFLTTHRPFHLAAIYLIVMRFRI